MKPPIKNLIEYVLIRINSEQIKQIIIKSHPLFSSSSGIYTHTYKEVYLIVNIFFYNLLFKFTDSSQRNIEKGQHFHKRN